MSEDVPQGQQESIKKTTEELGAQAGRMAKRLLERAAAVDTEHRTDENGKGFTVKSEARKLHGRDHSDRGGDRVIVGDHSKGTVINMDRRDPLLQATDDEFGQQTGQVQFQQFDYGQKDLNKTTRTTYVDKQPGKQLLRRGVSNDGSGVETAVAHTAETLAEVRSEVAKAEQRQRDTQTEQAA